MNELNESEEEEIVTVVLEEAREKWDCESICSKYINGHFKVCQSISTLIKCIYK